jgi:hypothetical protein
MMRGSKMRDGLRTMDTGEWRRGYSFVEKFRVQKTKMPLWTFIRYVMYVLYMFN